MSGPGEILMQAMMVLMIGGLAAMRIVKARNGRSFTPMQLPRMLRRARRLLSGRP